MSLPHPHTKSVAGTTLRLGLVYIFSIFCTMGTILQAIYDNADGQRIEGYPIISSNLSSSHPNSVLHELLIEDYFAICLPPGFTALLRGMVPRLPYSFPCSLIESSMGSPIGSSISLSGCPLDLALSPLAPLCSIESDARGYPVVMDTTLLRIPISSAMSPNSSAALHAL